MRLSVDGVKGDWTGADFNLDLTKVRASRLRCTRPPSSCLTLWIGWRRFRVVVMAVVEDFADAATCALGNFACALSGTDADVLASDTCTFADVFCGSGWVKGDEIAGAFADALGCRSGSFSCALTNVASSAADVSAGTAGLGLGRGLRLGGGLG